MYMNPGAPPNASPVVTKRRRSGKNKRLKPEVKYIETNVASAAITTTWDILNSSLNLIQQGTTRSTRIGGRVTCKKIQFRMTLDTDLIGTANDMIRVVVYLDKQCNGIAATGTQIMQVDNLYSFRNTDNSGRFKILFDETYTLNIQAYSLDGPRNFSNSKYIEAYIDCDETLEFDASTGVITDLTSNNFGIMAASLNGTSNINGIVRLKYTDV